MTSNTNYLLGVAGAKLDSAQTISDGPAFGLGEIAKANNAGTAVYVKASTTPITQYDTVWIDGDFMAAPITPALAITAGRIGFAQVAITTSGFGWVLLTGKPSIRVGASCLPNVPLFTTDTAGVLDDATASASQYCIWGVNITASASTGVQDVTALAAYPVVRRLVT